LRSSDAPFSVRTSTHHHQLGVDSRRFRSDTHPANGSVVYTFAVVPFIAVSVNEESVEITSDPAAWSICVASDELSRSCFPITEPAALPAFNGGGEEGGSIDEAKEHTFTSYFLKVVATGEGGEQLIEETRCLFGCSISGWLKNKLRCVWPRRNSLHPLYHGKEDSLSNGEKDHYHHELDLVVGNTVLVSLSWHDKTGSRDVVVAPHTQHRSSRG
jgi:hypothetical protein